MARSHAHCLLLATICVLRLPATLARAALQAEELQPTFGSYIQQYGRSYRRGTKEYGERKALFEARLAEAVQHNAQKDVLWTAAINKLSDRTDEELSRLRGWRGGAHPYGSAGGVGTVGRHFSLASRASAFLSMTGWTKPIPDQVNWLHLNASSRVRNQGSCGSCWAIASATILEAHAEIHAAPHGRTFSAQELISCVPNPARCGGGGGCDGATVELALDWAMRNGLAEEEQSPYTEVAGQCSRRPVQQKLEALEVGQEAAIGAPGVHRAKAGMGGAIFGMRGWARLPENSYEALLRAVVEQGPVAVSAAASRWFSYSGGIFHGCEKDSVIDHAVTLMGFGHDSLLGEKFWLVQNSWGTDWGENGRIRLLRRDGDDQEQCGIDNQPELGTGCAGGPKEVRVCGMCGILYDSALPIFGSHPVH